MSDKNLKDNKNEELGKSRDVLEKKNESKWKSWAKL